MEKNPNSPWKKKTRPPLFRRPKATPMAMRNGEEMGGEQSDLELRSRTINNGGNLSSSPRDFNLEEFLTLANKVIDHGDSQAMDALKDLKRRWEARFGIGKSRLPVESLNVDDHLFARKLKQACRRRTTPATTILGTGSSGLAATFQRRPAVRGRIITSSPPATLHSKNANQISPATVGIPTKDDVRNVADMDASMDNVGADVAGHVSDMEAYLEHTADISPSRADIIAAARADISDYIDADVSNDTGTSRANVSAYTIKSRADIIDDTGKATADISADTCKNRADVSNSVERKQAIHDAPIQTGLYVGNMMHTRNRSLTTK
ncbi:UNVERIFIED_CONTAM: hypothetical protein Sindi_1673200 [Sesamum indicum]